MARLTDLGKTVPSAESIADAVSIGNTESVEDLLEKVSEDEVDEARYDYFSLIQKFGCFDDREIEQIIHTVAEKFDPITGSGSFAVGQKMQWIDVERPIIFLNREKIIERLPIMRNAASLSQESVEFLKILAQEEG